MTVAKTTISGTGNGRTTGVEGEAGTPVTGTEVSRLTNQFIDILTITSNINILRP